MITLGKYSQKIKAVVVGNMGVIIHPPGLVDLADKLREKGVKLADQNLDSDVINNIDVMIGIDYYHDFIKGFNRQYGVNLLNSSGGKLICGPIPSSFVPSSNSSGITMHVTVMRVTENYSPLSITDLVEERTTDIYKLYALETIGIQPDDWHQMLNRHLKPT